MGIDLSSVKTLLAVNGLSPQSPAEDIKKMLLAAKYSAEEAASALTLLAQPDAPRPSTITIPVDSKISSYPGVTPVVTEKKHGHSVTVILLVLLIGLCGAGYYGGAARYPAVVLGQPALCVLMPDTASQATCTIEASPTPAE